MCLAQAHVQINLCPYHPTGGALISAGTLTSAPLTESISAHSHVDMSALLLKLQTEREKREALEHEVDIMDEIIKRRLEERSVVQSAADYKQTLFSEMLHVQLYLVDQLYYTDQARNDFRKPCRLYTQYYRTV